VSMSALQQSDEWVMCEVANGCGQHLSVLVRRYATPLMTFLRRMVADAHRSEELFQEVFLAVWKHRTRYLYPQPFRPWLYQIALNKCREDLRRQWRHPVIRLDQLSAEPASIGMPLPPDAAVALETETIVLAAIELLPDQQRAVLVMRIWNELPFDEIADAVGCTASTARSHMHHALTGLRKYLEPRMR
jgi:RNA polymerase sigma-70 factor, ECF subfamily